MDYAGCIIYSRPDGTYVLDGYHVCPRSIDPQGRYDIDDLQAWLAEHKVTPPPEPAPPAPTPAELAAAERARTLADLAALDARAIRPLRAIAAGTATDGDRKELALIETEAVELRKRLV